MTSPAKLQTATVADLLAIPEEHRSHEIIDGVLVEKEAASARHGRAQVRVARRLGPYDRPGGWWFATEVEIQLSETQVFRPDVLGWRRDRMPEMPVEVPIVMTPDWICEILSSNRRNAIVTKKRAYREHRVGHYWLLDPSDKTLTVYRWHADGYVELLVAERHETVRAEPFDAIELRVAVLFGDDDDE